MTTDTPCNDVQTTCNAPVLGVEEIAERIARHRKTARQYLDIWPDTFRMGAHDRNVIGIIKEWVDENATLIARLRAAEEREHALKDALLHFVDFDPPDGHCMYCTGYEEHKPYCPYAIAQTALAASSQRAGDGGGIKTRP